MSDKEQVDNSVEMADLADLQPHNRTIEILHPVSKEPVGVRVTLRPMSHKAVKKAQRKNLDAQLNSKSKDLNAETVYRNNDNLLVAAIEDWEWYGISFKGRIPECTDEEVRLVFNTLDWMRDQVKDEFDDAESFFDE